VEEHYFSIKFSVA